MKKEYAELLLNEMREIYNLIAKDYSRTRAFISNDLKNLGNYAKSGEKILDLGCANGRFYEVLENKNVDFYGVDFSRELIEMAKNKYRNGKFYLADARKLPFSDNFFDKIYSISVLHHIPSYDFRMQFLKEANRTLKPGGLLILRVWDFWKRKMALKLISKYTLLKLLGKSNFDFKDVFVSWKDQNGNILANRYFHCFTQGELKNLIKKAGFKIKEIWREGEDPRTNIYLVAEKPVPVA